VRLVGAAMAQNATAAPVAKPVSLPDMALGPTKAAVTIIEYASMSCPHCAAFEELDAKLKTLLKKLAIASDLPAA
jgi:protein-disulfide isomerase